jgi:hypothetical protein
MEDHETPPIAVPRIRVRPWVALLMIGAACFYSYNAWGTSVAGNLLEWMRAVILVVVAIFSGLGSAFGYRAKDPIDQDPNFWGNRWEPVFFTRSDQQTTANQADHTDR